MLVAKEAVTLSVELFQNKTPFTTIRADIFGELVEVGSGDGGVVVGGDGGGVLFNY